MLLPLYLLHVTGVEHSEGLLWMFICINIFVVTSGIVFMYKLFKQKNIRAAAFAFGIALAVNYILIAIFGDPFDLLG
ncbi:hypothetical protein [Neobacillus muris]|uniref:hypothetical protein n=1 Tax=Neobacillus muris TaxID=2941334 RepID=UPI00203EEA5E|nr:hypothetical protein [Neobacillus muris]